MGISILDIMRLGRVHTAMVTAAVPAAGCLAAGGGWWAVLFVVLGSMIHHSWGFSMNEIVDLEVDRRNRELQHKPLVSGRMDIRSAIIISRIFHFMAGILFLISAYFFGGNIFTVMVFLALASIFGWTYNRWGKKVPMMDISIALWMFFLVLAGASAGSEGISFPIGVWAIAVIGFLHILFNNSVEGGLKDVANDRRSNTKTLAVVTGAKFEKGLLRPGGKILVWGTLLRMMLVLTAAVFSFLISEKEGWDEWIVILVSVWGIAVFAHSLIFLQKMVRISRKDLIGTFAKHEVLSFGLSLLVVMPLIGVAPTLLLFIVPFIWFALMNRVLFDSGLAPKV